MADRLFLGPLRGREAGLVDVVLGLCGQPHGAASGVDAAPGLDGCAGCTARTRWWPGATRPRSWAGWFWPRPATAPSPRSWSPMATWTRLEPRGCATAAPRRGARPGGRGRPLAGTDPGRGPGGPGRGSAAAPAGRRSRSCGGRGGHGPGPHLAGPAPLDGDGHGAALFDPSRSFSTTPTATGSGTRPRSSSTTTPSTRWSATRWASEGEGRQAGAAGPMTPRCRRRPKGGLPTKGPGSQGSKAVPKNSRMWSRRAASMSSAKGSRSTRPSMNGRSLK